MKFEDFEQEVVRNCKFKFECPKNWFDLEDTEEDTTKYCNHCDEKVYFVKTAKDLKKHLLANHCIAINNPKAPRLHTMGLPAYEGPFHD